MGELFQEVVLDDPGVLEPHLLGQDRLVDRLVEDVGLAVRVPRSRVLELVKEGEFHGAFLVRGTWDVGRRDQPPTHQAPRPRKFDTAKSDAVSRSWESSSGRSRRSKTNVER